MGEITRGHVERMREFLMLDKARVARCCSVIKDHNIIGYGFQKMSHAQDTADFKCLL